MRQGGIERAAWAAALLCASLSSAKAAGPELVVVTAAPPTPPGTAVFSSITLDAADLRGANQLDSALAQVPGLSLFRRNSSLSANPTTQGVSLRSIAPSGAGRALVTLDGVPQNDPFGGWVIWSAAPPEDIAAATVLKGAGAGPYGAGALTGTIALREETQETLAASASWGTRSTGHASASGGASLADVSLFASAAIDSSAGWIAVSPAMRGAADVPVTLNARSASLRAQTQMPGETLLSARLGLYDEARHSGLGATASRASGLSTSLTLVHPIGGSALGWRLQGWLRASDLQNSSASVSADRALATPANAQYATPALGWGLNAALRGSLDWLEWEMGADARSTRGNSHEHFSYVAGSFRQGRISGGKTSVAGLYAEGASHVGDLLITLGLRADRWDSSNGHLLQTVLASGATTTTLYPARHGIVPTARGGVRYALAENLYLRSAAYTGFRAPTLNELYRPFRLGNTTTAANPDLTPEEYYGVEFGIGGTSAALSWDGDIFFNQLHAAITNVTIGPNAFQRRNAGNINAIGVEANARYRLSNALSLRAAVNFTDARTHALRPAQAPRWTMTAGVDAAPLERLTLSANLHVESNRFADDQNTLPLGSATTLDARIAYRVTDRLEIFITADNLLDAVIATTASASPRGPLVSVGPPRMLRSGIRLLR